MTTKLTLGNDNDQLVSPIAHLFKGQGHFDLYSKKLYFYNNLNYSTLLYQTWSELALWLIGTHGQFGVMRLKVKATDLQYKNSICLKTLKKC